MAFSKPDVKIVSHEYKGYEVTEDPINHVISPSLPAFKLQPSKFESNKFYYGLRIVAGYRKQIVKLPKTVYFFLTGSIATSGSIRLSRSDRVLGLTHPVFSNATFDDVVFESSQNLGEVQVVGLSLGELDTSKEDLTMQWYVQFITLVDFQYGHKETTFPCYHWIEADGKSVTCTANMCTLQQVSNNPLLVAQRQEQIDRRKGQYIWKIYPNGLPSSIDFDEPVFLPPDEEFERAKWQTFLGNVEEIIKGFLDQNYRVDIEVVIQVLEKLLGKKVSENESLETLNEYDALSKQLLIEELKRADPPKQITLDVDMDICKAYRWVSDQEFGRQILNGVNPVVIQRCVTLPDYFPVTNEMVSSSLIRGLTLKEEMEAGHVYICDLSTIMDGLPCKEGYYCAAPICLLYMNNASQLLPIAIQLKKDPGEDNPIFVPTDHWIDWLLAKIYYRSADAQLHQLGTHYIPCHAAMEAYGMATMRNLPDAHPLYKLLFPHFHYTMAINSAARLALINDGGLIDFTFAIGGKGKDLLFERLSQLYMVQSTNIKENVVKRGVDDPTLLPGYYYRDDGLKIWNAIESYSTEILNLFYQTDDDVKNDTELQNWSEEIHNIAFPDFNGAAQGHGFPNTIETKEDLVKYCTLIMFTGSAQHAAVNFGQFDIYGYPPNAPFSMRKPLPTKKGEGNYKTLLHTLPSSIRSAVSTMLVFGLSQFSSDEVYLGGYPMHWFTDEKAKDITVKFNDELRALESDFKKRNFGLEMPYEYLLPSRIPNSITI